MMTDTKNKIAKEVSMYYSNPAIIQQVSLDLLEEATEGKFDIVDASNPFMFLLEASASNTHAAMTKCESVAREIYPLLATKYSDLYNHMSDVDYLDRFAAPSRTTFTLVIPVETLKKNTIKDPQTGVGKVTIPKDTSFLVGGYDWYVHRPIDILMAVNGAIQVYYDMSVSTPLVANNSNLLNYDVVNNRGVEELVIDIPVEQLRIETSSIPVSPSNGFNMSLSFTDNFYHVRAYHEDSTGTWQEMAVTHSGQVYDASVPTLVAVVEDNVVKLQLPEIYSTSQSIGDTIRIDLFTTKGAVDVDLSDYTASDFEGRWSDLDNPLNKYIAPLKEMTDLVLFSGEAVVGGRDPLTFAELRNRVIYRSADSRASITFEELNFELNDRGYKVTKSKDNLTQRKYICSRPLPTISGDSNSGSIGVRHGSVTVDTGRADLGGVLLDQGRRKTISTSAIYLENSGSIVLLSAADIATLSMLKNLNREGFAADINARQYYYSPFVYVLDPASSLYSVRAYYLDNPSSDNRSFVDSNTILPYAVNTKNVDIVRNGTNFIITVTADGPKGITGVHGQLVYADGSGKKYRLNAPQVSVTDSRFTLTFTLTSTLDITADGLIEFDNLTSISGGSSKLLAELTSTFELFYVKENTEDDIPSTFDASIDKADFPTAIGVTRERLDINFGSELTNLHVRSKGKILPPVYETYEEDLIAVYPEDVYERDTEGKLIWTMDVATNTPVFNKLHSTGDEVYVDGEPVYAHRAGDVVTNGSGEPNVGTGERLVWEIEPILLDAKYMFADTASVVDYRVAVAEAILGYLKRDIDVVSLDMMARTELALQPTASIGRVTAVMDGKTTMVTDTALSFSINYMLIPGAYEDMALRSELVKTTKIIINEVLEGSTFSVSELVSRLKVNGGGNVVDVDVGKPLGEYNTATLIPGNSKFSIRTELTALSNGRLDVVDALEVTFTNKVLA